MAEATGARQGLRVCVGAISGTSLDAIDVAVLRTDGQSSIEFLGSDSGCYTSSLRNRLFKAAKQAASQGGLTEDRSLEQLDREVAQSFSATIRSCIEKCNIDTAEVNLIGFHGQTVWHDPDQAVSRQLGDCAWLAKELGIAVVGEFRQADLLAGGQGAPLAPLYHAALVADQPQPLVVLNLGGVGNLTYVDGEQLLAFDTGPANALLDDFMRQRQLGDFDMNGALSKQGQAVNYLVEKFTDDPYFKRIPPKSLDRFHFHATLDKFSNLSDADGAATLLAMSVASVKIAQSQLPKKPRTWLVCGGGRLNSHLMSELQSALDAPVVPIEKIGASGDSIEAETFAYLAARSEKNLPLSYPGTTGVANPTPGGRIFRP